MIITYITLVACFVGVLTSAEETLNADEVNELLDGVIPALQNKTSEALDTLSSILVTRRKRSIRKRNFWDDAGDFLKGAAFGAFVGRDADESDKNKEFDAKLDKAEEAIAVLDKAVGVARESLEKAKGLQ